MRAKVFMNTKPHLDMGLFVLSRLRSTQMIL